MSEPRVTKAFLSFAKGLWDMEFMAKSGCSARADLILDDGSTETFSWYHDEIAYTASDFVGKTMKEISQMHYDRDLAYLRT